MKLGHIAVGGAAGIMSLGLIGFGAHAAFTTSTVSQQQVTAGTLSVHASSPGATSGNGTVATPLVLQAVGPTQSSFVTSFPVTITNVGNINATELTIRVTATNNGTTQSSALQSQMWACLSSHTRLLFNEPLQTAINYGTIVLGTTTLHPGQTDNYTLTLYAGTTDAGCGATFTAISGGAFQPTPVQTIVPGAKNTAAQSLTNTAENGVVTPKVTMSYQG